MKEQLSASADVHDKVELRLALKRPMQLDDEGVVHLLQNASLRENGLDLVLINQAILSQLFDCIESTSILFPG